MGGDRFEEQTLVKDLDVTDIHCYDFDKDGDLDILLTFNYNEQFGFSFLLVFAENKGNGVLKSTKTVTKGHWTLRAVLGL